MVTIAVSGPPGGGKSTVAKFLAEKLKLKFYSTGQFFRKKAAENNMSMGEYLKVAPKNLHLEADSNIDKMSKEGDIVIDARLAGHMASKANFKIFITAPAPIRAERISKREGNDLTLTLKNMIERENDERKIYKKIYDIDVTDLNIYDLSLNTEFLDKEAVSKIVLEVVKLALKI